jgi:ectoine hydroxylase-related dioxygenase (phytanoyl-CoA dioxygenase family)
MLTQQQQDRYAADGYVIIEGLFNDEEVAYYCEHYMRMRVAGSYPGDDAGVASSSTDPLRRFPRLIHMHRWDDVSLSWLLEARLNQALTSLLGREPYAVQTMLYFKPAGARGQALHQDNYYLRVQPGTCMAAWMALDDCDEENGCMQVVAGSHRWPLLCTVEADTKQSFTDVTVPLPPDVTPSAVPMRAGDVLFFNGQLIHGSFPNTSTNRFRRALIGHYIEGDANQVGKWYHPALHMDGRPLEIGVSPGAMPCGIWVDSAEGHQIEERGTVVVDPDTHD